MEIPNAPDKSIPKMCAMGEGVDASLREFWDFEKNGIYLDKWTSSFP